MDFILSTPRLRLHPFLPHEDALFWEINTEPSVREYLWDGEEIPRSLAREIMEKNAHHLKHDKWGLWIILDKREERLLGYTGLWPFFDPNQPELLYALLPEATGQGYATEAARAVISYAFEKLGFSYVAASMDSPHQASRSVCLRLGMDDIGEKIMDGKPTTFFRLDAPA
ncbi:MAG: GNAT family N-acetyltransferase [Bacteroidota bacterium]